MKRFSTYFTVICLTLSCLFNIAYVQIMEEPVAEEPVFEEPVAEEPVEEDRALEPAVVYFPTAGPKITGPYFLDFHRESRGRIGIGDPSTVVNHCLTKYFFYVM